MMMVMMTRRNLFKRRWMKAETWRFGDWSSSFTRGGGGMGGETLELDRTGQQGAVEDGCYVSEACFCLKKKKSIKSIDQSEPLMVHCHFLLPSVDFPPRQRYLFFFFS